MQGKEGRPAKTPERARHALIDSGSESWQSSRRLGPSKGQRRSVLVVGSHTIDSPARAIITETMPKNQCRFSIPWPGTLTFMPHSPVMTLRGTMTVPRAVSLLSTSLIWLFASVISMEICARSVGEQRCSSVSEYRAHNLCTHSCCDSC